VDLLATEIRVLGCLLEKQRTTPETYPLTLNALRAACNQSTNRDPVVAYDDATVRDALTRLGARRFTRLSGAGRAPKFRHLLDETLPMSPAARAVLTILMLRGPQTPGELKGRAERLHAFEDLGAVHAALDELMEAELARRLDRRPGQKEERYAHALSEDDDEPAAHPAAPAAAPAPAAPAAPRREAPDAEERLARLEADVADLRRELGELRALLD
jgi:uncharacterized protein YceH (UPF0502 family)